MKNLNNHSLRGRRRKGKGRKGKRERDWGDQRGMPAVRRPFTSFLRSLTEANFRLPERQ